MRGLAPELGAWNARSRVSTPIFGPTPVPSMKPLRIEHFFGAPRFDARAIRTTNVHLSATRKLFFVLFFLCHKRFADARRVL